VLSVPKGDAEKLKANVVSQQPLLAPIAKGQQIGTLQLSLNDKPSANTPSWPSTKSPSRLVRPPVGRPPPVVQEPVRRNRMTEERTTLLEFPCEFPIKIMGARVDTSPRRCSKWCCATPPTSTPPRCRCALVQGQLPVDHLHRQRHLPGPARRAVRRAVVPPAGEGRPVIVRRPGLRALRTHLAGDAGFHHPA
jgi:hypothetical protein